jgi:hypothetical protein
MMVTVKVAVTLHSDTGDGIKLFRVSAKKIMVYAFGRDQIVKNTDAACLESWDRKPLTFYVYLRVVFEVRHR